MQWSVVLNSMIQIRPIFISSVCHFRNNNNIPPVVTDTDECERGLDNCDPNAQCHNTPGSFTCSCKIDYFGNGTTCTGKGQPYLVADHCTSKLAMWLSQQ